METARIKVTNVFQRIYQSNHRFNLIMGGAGSSKSYSMAQFFIQKVFTEPGKQFMVFRKTFPSMRLTAMPLLLNMIGEFGYTKDEHYTFNKTEHKLTSLINGSELWFSSLDDPAKIKSATLNYVWIEEATELNFPSFNQLNLRLRGKNDLKNQMYLTFNPIGQLNWIYTDIIEKNIPGVYLDKSTYKDNPYLSDDYRAQIEALKNIDNNLYKIYALGEWGQLENIIFSHYDIVDGPPDNPDEIIYGQDYGYNNPTGMIRIYIKDEEYWIEEMIYKRKMTNQDLIAEMEGHDIGEESFMYGDCAEPQRIEEIYRAGYNIHPSLKDKNSVKDGIDFCKTLKLHILKNSPNLIKELSAYSWKEDKDGNILDEPVKFNDHLIDGFRYALYTHCKHFGGTTEFLIG